MRLLIDTHTHTVASGHAYSTLLENIEAAISKGLQGIVVTDHAQQIPGTQPNFLVMVLDSIPDEYKGIRIFKGAEVNITDYDGSIDMDEKHLSVLDFVIASLHDCVITSGSKLDNTSALMQALANPNVDIIGHPGNPAYAIDEEALVKEAARLGKLLEINNHSFTFRKGSAGVCRKIMRLCKKYDVRISVGSDAHSCFKIGGFDSALTALIEEGFPSELIVSRNLETFEAYIAERTKRIGEKS